MHNWKRAAKLYRKRWLVKRRMQIRREDRLKDELAWTQNQMAIAVGALALLGMAFAIQERERRRPREEDDARYDAAMGKIHGED